MSLQAQQTKQLAQDETRIVARVDRTVRKLNETNLFLIRMRFSKSVFVLLVVELCAWYWVCVFMLGCIWFAIGYVCELICCTTAILVRI